MKSNQIRQKFFNYFVSRGHEKVTSSPLIPAQDPTILFTNAGMNQFKDLFLGNETRSYRTATSIQKCVRAGGKHNDLDNVGFTKRHLTFFEMMGNFSFGDYFKKEAIAFAWEFLTKELQLPEEKLYASVFETDDEAFAIWEKEVGLPSHKIYRLGADDNFWQMGDLGPCGPCTEIFYDRGPNFGCADIASCGPACNCDRFLEVWNLVFMQYDRQQNGELKPLKQTGVDTGMGFERLASVLQDVDSVFMVDVFAHIIQKTEFLTEKKYAAQTQDLQAAFHVLADHIRCATFLIADGCAPSNDGRGYVLRKIIRRAALFAQKLTDKNIFPELSKTVIEDMGHWYPELHSSQQLVYEVLLQEVEKFSINLIRGQVILDSYITQNAKTKIISGQQMFKLYDTFGFPLELVIAAARQKGFTVNQTEFEQLMEEQKKQSGQKEADPLNFIEIDSTTEFTGYTELITTSQVTHIISDNTLVSGAAKNQSCFIICKKSPFFIVGGGQVPDQGWLVINDVQVPIQSVRYIGATAIAAEIITPADIHVGDTITQMVDPQWRTSAMKNHTATHLLQSALIQLFGKTIKQAGSLVHPDYLRFDFSYHNALSDEDIAQVEKLVNEKIMQNISVTTEFMTLKTAVERGALAFFGDKYKPESVRMVQVSDFSSELCGGTHVRATGDIGPFKIIEVSSPAAGQRRIVAVTGPKAVELFSKTFMDLKQIGQAFKVKPEQAYAHVCKQLELTKELQSQSRTLRKELAIAQVPQLLLRVQSINEIPFLYHTFGDATVEELRDIAQQLEQKSPGFYFLMSTTAQKVIFYAIISGYYTLKLSPVVLQSWLQNNFSIRGGIRQNTLQGGCQTYDNTLHDRLIQWIQEQ